MGAAVKERALPDDYPVYYGYLYVADGKVVTSDIEGTIRDLKRLLKAAVITNCDIVGRHLEARIA